MDGTGPEGDPPAVLGPVAVAVRAYEVAGELAAGRLRPTTGQGPRRTWCGANVGAEASIASAAGTRSAAHQKSIKALFGSCNRWSVSSRVIAAAGWLRRVWEPSSASPDAPR